MHIGSLKTNQSVSMSMSQKKQNLTHRKKSLLILLVNKILICQALFGILLEQILTYYLYIRPLANRYAKVDQNII